jgi:hypothetical protein
LKKKLALAMKKSMGKKSPSPTAESPKPKKGMRDMLVKSVQKKVAHKANPTKAKFGDAMAMKLKLSLPKI